MHAKSNRGEISKATVQEFDRATRGKWKSLPERVAKKRAELLEKISNAARVQTMASFTPMANPAAPRQPRGATSQAGGIKVPDAGMTHEQALQGVQNQAIGHVQTRLLDGSTLPAGR